MNSYNIKKNIIYCKSVIYIFKNRDNGSVVKGISHLTTDILRFFNSFVINTFHRALTIFYLCTRNVPVIKIKYFFEFKLFYFKKFIGNLTIEWL